jgi:hypothetical protein
VVIAIALSGADELAFGVDRKFGCSAIAYSSKTDAIAFFRFSYKAIAAHQESAFPSHLAQVKAIANLSCFEKTSLGLGFLASTLSTLLKGKNLQGIKLCLAVENAIMANKISIASFAKADLIMLGILAEYCCRKYSLTDVLLQ